MKKLLKDTIKINDFLYPAGISGRFFNMDFSVFTVCLNSTIVRLF